MKTIAVTLVFAIAGFLLAGELDTVSNLKLQAKLDKKLVTDLKKMLSKDIPKLELIGISEDEMSRLSAHIGSPINPSEKGFLETMSEKLTYIQIQSFPDDLRITAGKIIIQFLGYYHEQPDVTTKYIKPAECKKYDINISGEKVWSFNHQKNFEMLGLINELNLIYSEWFDNNSDYIKYHAFGIAIDDDQIENVIQYSEDFKPKLLAFISKLDNYLDPLEMEFNDLHCNMKNFLSYFGLLSRFYESYKSIPEGFTRKLRFYEIGTLMVRTRYRYNLIFSRISRMKLIGNVIKEYFFYISKEKNPVAIANYQRALLAIGNPISLAVKSVCYFNYRMEVYYKELKFILTTMEEASGIRSLPFPNLKFGCSWSMLLSSLKIIIFSIALAF
jgi:hypothetical protein